MSRKCFLGDGLPRREKRLARLQARAFALQAKDSESEKTFFMDGFWKK